MISPQEQRIQAVQSICTMLQSEEGSEAAVGVAKKLWPQLLALLSDLLPEVRQCAATAVGLMGAIATKATSFRVPTQGTCSCRNLSSRWTLQQPHL